MDPEDINNIMRELGYLRDLESLINECSHNSGLQNIQECANTSDITVNSPRSEDQISNSEEECQQAITSNSNHTDNTDLPRFSANVDATISNPALNDSLNPFIGLLDETQDAADIIAETEHENMFRFFFEPNHMVYNNPTEFTEADISALCENIAPLLRSPPIHLRKAKKVPSDSNPILSTEQQRLGTNFDNLDPMGRVVNEIFKYILAPNTMSMIRCSQNSARKPSSVPNHLTVIMAFIVLFYIILMFCY